MFCLAFNCMSSLVLQTYTYYIYYTSYLYTKQSKINDTLFVYLTQMTCVHSICEGKFSFCNAFHRLIVRQNGLYVLTRDHFVAEQ